MSNPPFGFGPSDPDKRGENEPEGGGQPSGADAFNQLGQMLSQLGEMLSQETKTTPGGLLILRIAKKGCF